MCLSPPQLAVVIFGGTWLRQEIVSQYMVICLTVQIFQVIVFPLVVAADWYDLVKLWYPDPSSDGHATVWARCLFTPS